MRKVLIGITVLLISSAWNAKAQKYWSLEECIILAQERNITIKRKELTTDASRNSLLQSKLNILPSLNAGGSHTLSSGRYLDLSDYTWKETTSDQNGSVGIRSEITLFSGFQNYNSVLKAKFDLLYGLTELQKAKNNISIDVATAFLQVLFSEELLQVAKNQLELSNLQVERNKKLVEVGNIARGNLLEIQAQAAREKVNVTNAENNLNIAYLNLTQLLELDSIGDFKIQKPDSLMLEEILPLQSVRDIYLQALENMPEVKSAEYFLNSSEKSLAIARGRMSPTISLSAGISSDYYERYKDRFSYYSQIKENTSKALSLNLSIPIFNGYTTRTQINNTRILVEDAEYNLIGVKKDLYKAIQQAHADALNAYQNYISRREAVISSEEAFKYNQQKYEVGLSSAVDFNIAKNNLTKANSDLLQSKYEYIFKSKILDFYKGTPLKI